MIELVKSAINEISNGKPTLTERQEYVMRECDMFERWLSNYKPVCADEENVDYEFAYDDSRADHMLMIIESGTFDNKKDILEELEKRGYHNIKANFRCAKPYLTFKIA